MPARPESARRAAIGPGAIRLRRAAAAAAIAAAMAVACTTTTPVTTGVEPPFPSPLAGPGVPEAPPAVREAVAAGWNALKRSGTAAALDASRRAGRHPLAVLLAHQAAYLDGGTGLTGPLEALTGAHPEWASAWITLSFAAEREGRTELAVTAAERAAALWPEPRWTARAARLRDAWAGPILEAARTALAGGDAEGALARLDRLEAAGVRDETVLSLRARALAAAGRPAEARELLRKLPETPERTAMAAALAEAARDWPEALRLYSALPEDWPGRDTDLSRVKLLWRLDNLPPSFRKALEAPELDRARMATVLVALAPQIEAAGGGNVPIMTDVVGIPEQREVLAVVRAGIMQPAGWDSNFRPEREVTPASAAEILGRLAAFLGRPLPPACGETPSPECLGLTAPVSGPMVRKAIWAILFPEEENGDHGNR